MRKEGVAHGDGRYGATRTARPDKAIGLRYEVFDGFKLSAAVGRGNDRSFGNLGVAWEF